MMLHYAISHYPKLNNIFSSIIQSTTFLNHTLWGYHHVIRHHQYTGMIEFDHDLHNHRPFYRKIKLNYKYKYEVSPNFLTYKYVIFELFIPGIAFGQSLSYLLWWKNKKLGKIRNYLISLAKLKIMFNIHFLIYILFYITYAGLPYLYCYIVGLNLLYWIGSAPDHGMYDTHNKLKITIN